MTRSVQGPEGGRTPGPEAQEQLSESSKATQLKSEGSLLKQIQAKHSSASRGVIGKVVVFFSGRTVKNEYIDSLKNSFLNSASDLARSSSIYNQTDASAVYIAHIAPVLKNLELMQIEGFETGLNHGMARYILSVAVDAPHDGRSLKYAVDNVATAGREAPEQVGRVIHNFSKAANFYGFDTAGSERELLDGLMTSLVNDRPAFDQTIQHHEEFITQAEASPEFKQHIRQKSEEEKRTLIKYSLTQEGHESLMRALREEPQAMQTAIDTMIQNNTGKTLDEMATLQIARKMMEKLDENERVQFQKAWLQTSQELSIEQFDDFLKKFSEHLVKREKIKAATPATKDIQEINASYEALNRGYPKQMEHFKFLKLH